MDTDGHGLKTGCVNEGLYPIGEPFIVFPSVFIRVHLWFLQVQVPDLGSLTLLASLWLRLCDAVKEVFAA